MKTAITSVWKYCGMNTILGCLSRNRLYIKMLRINVFSIFTFKTQWALAALAPLDLLIVKTLTHVLIPQQLQVPPPPNGYPIGRNYIG